jgi:hypothetical protein
MTGTQAQPTTTKETTQVKNLIQETTDYKIFNHLKHNRHVVEQHVLHLMQSMTAKPHLRPARPILVNENYEIIDGQHRLEAEKRRKASVFFMVVWGLTIDDARLLNALQRTWSLLDYAISYADEGRAPYVRFMQYLEKYKIPPAALAELMENQSSSMRKNFKIGKFAPKPYKEVEAALEALSDFSHATNGHYYREQRFVRAFQVMYFTPGYDHNRMLQKLGDEKLPRQSERLDYLRLLEDTYNKDIRFGNRVRFL